jgi:hypothetical protein
VGELLDGVRGDLATQVLPALPAGAAKRQLKAALHVLGELAQTWDRQRSTLEGNNADLENTIEAFCARMGLSREPVAESAHRYPGVSDEELRRVMARNESLQTELETLQQRWRRDPRTDVGADQLLLELHTRTTARAEGRDDNR